MIDYRGVVLREIVRQGVTWQARGSTDRGRLQIVAVVPSSSTPTIVEALSDVDVRELLAEAAAPGPTGWRCVECGADNEADRRWCRVCSSHGSAVA